METIGVIALCVVFILGYVGFLEIVWREKFEMDAVVEEWHCQDPQRGPWYIYIMLENGKRVRWDVSKRQFTSAFVGANMRIHCSRGRIFGDIAIDEEEGRWHEDIHPPFVDRQYAAY